jgi:uncharacterized protein YraI
MLRRALVVLTLMAGAANAAPETFRVSGIEPGSVLHVRERPEADAEVVARIPRNARGVRGFGCTNETPSGYTWCRVKYGDVVGWARRCYLQPE